MAKDTKSKEMPEELTEEQFDTLMKELDEFSVKFFTALAGTDKYEIIPTVLEDDTFLTKEQYTLVKNECSRLGLRAIYHIESRKGLSMYYCPETNKIGYTHEEMH